MLENIKEKELLKTILVMDDTADNFSLIVDLLKDKYRVGVANSLRKALNYLESSEIHDLILLDITVSKLIGYDAIKLLSQRRA